ncbi:MAG: DUF4249 family protein [Bacteroidales bacterium]|nr:DUF4249 family protein [Bacteroidales bacterium]
MKRISTVFASFFLGLILLCSCHDKPNLIADYKDVTISYGVLNINDDIHYFKIYKGFITEDNALVEAGNWENVYYPVDSLEVRLEEYMNGVRTRGEILDTTTMVPKEDGFFPSPKQLLYYSEMKLNPEATYRLVIRRVNTGEEVYAETVMVGDFSIRIPMNSWNFNMADENNNPINAPIRFYQAENAAAYDIYLTFYYVEMDKETKAVEHKSITKRLTSSLWYASPSSAENVYPSFAPKSFLTYIAQSLQPNDRVVRYIDALDGRQFHCFRMQIWAVSDEYLKYLDASTPNQSIVQDRFLYTNFVSENQDAYGFLASRNYCTRDLMMSSLDHNEDSLVKGSITGHLGFDYYRNSPFFHEE